jgi:hypothetical protein
MFIVVLYLRKCCFCNSVYNRIALYFSDIAAKKAAKKVKEEKKLVMLKLLMMLLLMTSNPLKNVKKKKTQNLKTVEGKVIRH